MTLRTVNAWKVCWLVNLIIGAKLKVHLLGTVRCVGLVWLVSALAPKTEIGHLKKAEENIRFV